MGPTPKDPKTRQRRNLRSTAAVVDASPAVRPEELETWHVNTKAWWTVIWASPISSEWVDADVPGLVALAQLVDDFWTADAVDRAKRHAEVRMASAQFGLSPMSRRQLQWEVRKVEGRPPAKPDRPSTRRTGPTVLAALQGGKGA